MVVSLLLYSLTEALFSASPGPAVVMIVALAMSGSWKNVHAAIFGILLGNLVYFVISCVLILGVSQYDDDFFRYIKIAGAAYLAYFLCARYFFAKPNGSSDEVAQSSGASGDRTGYVFFGGFAMQLANPKTILFFSAFLPQFVNADYNIPMQFVIMASLSWSIEYAILIGYASGTTLLLRRLVIHRADRLEHFGNAVMVVAIGWSMASIRF